MNRRELITGAAASALFAGLQDAEAMSPGHRVVLGSAGLPNIGWPGALSPTTYNGAVLAEPNLVWFCPLNDLSSATSFADLKGGRNAVIQNKGTGVLLAQTGLIPGDSNTASKFVGASSGDGLVSVADSAALDFDGASAFSMEIIVSPNITRSGGSTAYALLGKQSQNSPFPGYQYQLRWDGTSATRIEVTLINNSASNIAQLRGTSTDLANGTVYPVTWKYSGNKNTNGMQFYIAGVLEGVAGGNIANSLTGSISNSAQVSIGSRNNALQFVSATAQGAAIYSDNQSVPAIQYRHGLAIGRSALTPLTGDEPIIHDQDLNTDVDDVAEYPMWAYLKRKYNRNLVAVTISSANDYSAPCAEALLAHYGMTNVAIGAYQNNPAGLPTSSAYAQQVASRFGFGSKTRTDYSDAVTVMRTALAAAADGTVVMTGTGPLTNFSALLQSAGDGISPLTGLQLVTAKVKRFIYSGGAYPDSSLLAGGYESNFHKDITATLYVIANWPGEIVFTGYYIGHLDYSGPPSSFNPLTSPVKYAFDLWGTANPGGLINGKRESWGALHVLYVGLGDIVGVQTGGLRGTVVVSAVDASNTYNMAVQSNQSYIFERASHTVLGANCDTIIAALP
jgi:hypothetical protein